MALQGRLTLLMGGRKRPHPKRRTSDPRACALVRHIGRHVHDERLCDSALHAGQQPPRQHPPLTLQATGTPAAMAIWEQSWTLNPGDY